MTAYGATVVKHRITCPAPVSAAASVIDARKPIRSTTSGIIMTKEQYTTGPMAATMSTVPLDQPYTVLHWSTMGEYVIHARFCSIDVNDSRNRIQYRRGYTANRWMAGSAVAESLLAKLASTPP